MSFSPQQSIPAESDLLASLAQYLAPQFKDVDETLDGLYKHSQNSMLNEVGDYLLSTRGKKLRPAITILASMACNEKVAPPIQVATAMEIVHQATLIHDDVIDKATVRRGKPSINAQWGDEVAILMADYLYACAFELALHHLDPALLQLICRVTRQMCEGEMYQIQQRGRMLDEAGYLKIIQSKTADLFGACASLGAMTAGRDAQDIHHLLQFGHAFGLAFQVTDDTLDYMAHHDHWGKSVGIDFSEGKQTLPFILACREASEDDRKQMESLLAEGRDFEAMHALIEKYHAVDLALGKAQGYAKKACEHLEKVSPQNHEAYEYLMALPGYVLQRSY